MRKSDVDYDPLAESLRTLKPAMVQLSVERLAFEAGRRAGKRSTNAWRAVAGVITVAGVCAFGLRPKPATITTERVVVVHEQASPPDPEPFVSLASYLRLRDAVIADGWDALPPPTGGGGSPQRVIGVRSFE